MPSRKTKLSTLSTKNHFLRTGHASLQSSFRRHRSNGSGDGYAEGGGGGPAPLRLSDPRRGWTRGPGRRRNSTHPLGKETFSGSLFQPENEWNPKVLKLNWRFYLNVFNFSVWLHNEAIYNLIQQICRMTCKKLNNKLNKWLQNEAMTGTVHTQNPTYSRLTLALLEDSGWYVPNYDMVNVANLL